MEPLYWSQPSSSRSYDFCYSARGLRFTMRNGESEVEGISADGAICWQPGTSAADGTAVRSIFFEHGPGEHWCGRVQRKLGCL